MKIKTIIINLICVISFTCCERAEKENQEDITKLKIGMTFSEVKELMRNKSFDGRISDSKKSFYNFYKSPFSSSGDYYVEYSMKDSILISFYTGD